MKERNLLLAVAALVIVIAAAFALSSPRSSRFGGDGNETVETAAADNEPIRTNVSGGRLCASNVGFQQLKTAAFREAVQVRGDSGNLDRLAATSVVRMEQSEVTSEDAETGLVTCTGRFVIELPPGAERGFGGQRRLAADVTYTARAGADGGAAVYELTGADELVSTLAAFDIDSSLQRPAPAAPADVQTAEAIPPEEQLPVIIRREPAPERPTRKQEEEERRPSPPPARAEREQPKERPRPAPPPARPAPRAERPEPARTAVRPSFDCRQAGTRSERLVCGSERLAAKDREMARYYFRQLEGADPRTRRELERTRNRFLRYRERCPNEACVADAYDGRMAEIRDIVAGIE